MIYDKILETLAPIQRYIADTFDATPNAFMTPQAFVVLPDGGIQIIAMPQCNTQQQRECLKRLLPASRAVAVFVITEVWKTAATTPEDVSLCATLLRQGRLSEAPERLRQEEVQIWLETPATSLECWGALVTRGEGGIRSLSATWEQPRLQLPHDGWRRYFPDVKPGSEGEAQ